MERSHECEICFNKYNESRKPHMLPCGHTLCKFCIEDITKRRIILCPMCQKEFVSDLNKFPINYTVLSPSKAQPTGTSSNSEMFESCKFLQNEIHALEKHEKNLAEIQEESQYYNNKNETEAFAAIESMIQSLKIAKNQIKQRIEESNRANNNKLKKERADITAAIEKRQKLMRSLLDTQKNSGVLDAESRLDLNTLRSVSNSELKIKKSTFTNSFYNEFKQLTDAIQKSVCVDEEKMIVKIDIVEEKKLEAQALPEPIPEKIEVQSQGDRKIISGDNFAFIPSPSSLSQLQSGINPCISNTVLSSEQFLYTKKVNEIADPVISTSLAKNPGSPGIVLYNNNQTNPVIQSRPNGPIKPINLSQSSQILKPQENEKPNPDKFPDQNKEIYKEKIIQTIKDEYEIIEPQEQIKHEIGKNALGDFGSERGRKPDNYSDLRRGNYKHRNKYKGSNNYTKNTNIKNGSANIHNQEIKNKEEEEEKHQKFDKNPFEVTNWGDCPSDDSYGSDYDRTSQKNDKGDFKVVRGRARGNSARPRDRNDDCCWFLQIDKDLKPLPKWVIIQLEKKVGISERIEIYNRGVLSNVVDLKKMLYFQVDHEMNKLKGMPKKLVHIDN